jgi:hypothetical protein
MKLMPGFRGLAPNQLTYKGFHDDGETGWRSRTSNAIEGVNAIITKI